MYEIKKKEMKNYSTVKTKNCGTTKVYENEYCIQIIYAKLQSLFLWKIIVFQTNAMKIEKFLLMRKIEKHKICII
jgi:hypothetical protein